MLLMYCGCKKLKGRENEEEIDGRGNELVEGAVLVDIVVREEVLPEGEVVLLDVLLGEVVLLEVMVGVVVVGEVVLLDGVVREGILLNVELEEKVMLLLLLGEGEHICRGNGVSCIVRVLDVGDFESQDGLVDSSYCSVLTNRSLGQPVTKDDIDKEKSEWALLGVDITLHQDVPRGMEEGDGDGFENL